MFENGVLGYIVGPKRDEITTECTRLHNEQHYDLYDNFKRVFKKWDAYHGMYCCDSELGTGGGRL
jgi:hypothetical protein